NFRDEWNVQAQASTFLKRGIIEEVDYVSSKAIFQAAAFVEIEWAGGVNLQLLHVAYYCAQLALELQRALPYLRHGKGYNMVWHSMVQVSLVRLVQLDAGNCEAFAPLGG